MNPPHTDTPHLLPSQVLFDGETQPPTLPAIDHYCGAEKLMCKAADLQQNIGEAHGHALFDITFDCEDGAVAGQEERHARRCGELIASDINRYNRIGARIHDVTHVHWQSDVDLLCAEAGDRLAYLTIPKPRSVDDVRRQIDHVNATCSRLGLQRTLPIHVLIETHGALREAHLIAAHPQVESLDFGLMDFVSAHHGAIPASAMRSPGQFEHALVARAKVEIAAAALAHGAIPTHNVCTNLKDATVIGNDAQRARQEFGYLRMWSIHPAQIEPILQAMRPDFNEVETAAEILLAAQAAHWGPIQHQGILHDRASYRYYWSLLQRAKSTGCPIPPHTISALGL